MSYQTGTKQKWQPAMGLMMAYYPILFYIDFPVYSPDREFMRSILAYQLVTGGFSLGCSFCGCMLLNGC